MSNRDIHRNQHQANDTPGFALMEALGPQFAGFVERLRGRRLHVPLRPTEDFVELCGKDIARALLLNFPGEPLRVPTTVLFDPRLLRQKVLATYASGATVGEISAALGIGNRSVADILAANQGSADFKRAQQARIIALAQHGMTVASIAARSRATVELVRRIILQARVSPSVTQAGANPDVTARARISDQERERFIDLYGQGLLLSEIASRLGVALPRIRSEAGTFEAKCSATLSARRVYSLYERGLDDIDIAMECRQPLSMVHSTLSKRGVRFEAGGAPCPRHSAIKSDGHLTRATGGSEGSLPPHHRSTTFAARAAS